MNTQIAIYLSALITALCLGGCLHAPTPASPPTGDASLLTRAEQLFKEGRTSDALIECVNLTRQAPDTPGLDALRRRIVEAELARRENSNADTLRTSEQAMNSEAKGKALLPDTYGLTRTVTNEAGSLRTPQTALQKTLQQPVTMHLKNADLGAIIEAIGRAQHINMVADKDVGTGRTVNVEMDNVPLNEMLDYVARNLGVEFYLGRDVVWVTSANQASTVPLETRIYKLKHGMQFHAGDWDNAGQETTSNRTARRVENQDSRGLPGLTDNATELSVRNTSMEDVIRRFVPTVHGADIQFERNMHLLIVRNTRANLALIEDLVAALDAVPPQVLIEARFVTTRVSDLRELGIDWILNSSYGLIREQGRRSYTQIGNGSSARYSPYGFDDKGTFPLGPQGSFGANRSSSVNPPTASQGMNLTYRGVLTEPLFEAVLHALDISGKGRTLSVPRVTTVNNTPAKLRNGQDLLYFDEFQAQVFATYDPVSRVTQNTAALIPRGKPVKEELGITLLAVPSVGADLKDINLMLMPTISQEAGWTDYQNVSTNETRIGQVVAKLPRIVRQEVQTKVIVQSGETVVMGGLISSVKQTTLHKIPFLSDLPLIGKLFTRLDETEENENLLIFVTASVVSERGETLVAKPPL